MVKKSSYSEKKFEGITFPGEPEFQFTEKELITPVCLFLDTSVMPRVPRNPDIHFSKLSKINKLGLIKIYLSVVAFKEYESHLKDAWNEDIKNINIGIELIKKHNWLSVDFISLEKLTLLETIKEKFNDPDQLFEELFQKELSSMNYEILKIQENHANNVFMDYFTGSEPFNDKKKREDLPDAFIYQCALELTKNLETPLHCIVNDKKLRTSLDKIEDIITYQSIDSFFDGEIGKEIIELYKEVKFTSELKSRVDLLHERYDDSELIEFIKEDMIKGEFSPNGLINIGVPAKIEEVYECNNFNAWWDYASEIGPGVIYLPFQAIFTVKISFETSQYEYLKNSGLDIADIFSAEYQAKIIKHKKVKIEVESNITFHFDITNIDDVKYDNFYLDEYYHVNLVEDEN